jgi:hypothetical protein
MPFKKIECFGEHSKKSNFASGWFPKSFYSIGSTLNEMGSRVARWFIIKPKIPVWVFFGGPKIGKSLYIPWQFSNILRTLGIFYDRLVHFEFIWCIFSFLVSCAKKNLATLNWEAFQNR